jgi:hypothetical protein
LTSGVETGAGDSLYYAVTDEKRGNVYGERMPNPIRLQGSYEDRGERSSGRASLLAVASDEVTYSPK